MKKPVTVALRGETLEALDQIADQEERSRSQVTDRALREWLTARAEQAATAAPAATEPARQA